ncbi:tRNA (guanosine(37)-N1)-methyltransferase TrmD [Desulfonatronovibrio magnus]|uniref:tRNA (guanosine(37)-N1)-methyltransferase TrmD n=1 Tax=Desulfonatronovibrio magnus TaxID=698827 RepID=UPI0005EB0B66|nr:tRNA (guanosine(37)-N1)-methyltransferase TrmD [Desulfonatronovibrio magnus]
MHFHIISILPEYFTSPLSCGLLGKAIDNGIISTSMIYPRDFTHDRHSTVDDRPYGGGPGMVMKVDPLLQAIQSLPQGCTTVLLTPKGKPLSHSTACRLSLHNNIALICGRYEGIDARLEDLAELELISAGDFVLNGGEAAALCLMEAVARFLPGFMGKEESVGEESFSHGLLEYPHYTRPEIFQNKEVPEVLLSGHHGRIERWRRDRSLENTLNNRPELLDKTILSSQDTSFLKSVQRAKPSRNLYLTLLHWPVLNKFGKSGTTSLTNLDIHDIARVSETFGLGGYYICTPLKDQQLLAERLITHWTTGPGSRGNPDRAAALSRIRVASNINEAIKSIEEKTGARPHIVATSARGDGDATYQQVRETLSKRPVLLVLGTGHGLSPDIMDMADNFLRPVRYLSSFNHLSVRSAASIMVDRLIGDYL